MFQDRSVFKRVYRYAFVVGKEQSQRALSLENALIYWDILLTKTGWEWKSANVDWLEEWKTFLSEKWSRSVSRDMWNQLLEFAFQSCDDESLSFWNEDAAWPGVIDEFVMWYRTKEQSKHLAPYPTRTADFIHSGSRRLGRRLVERVTRRHGHNYRGL